MVKATYLAFEVGSSDSMIDARGTPSQGITIDQAEAMGPLLGTAAFPALVGVAYLIMWRFGARKE